MSCQILEIIPKALNKPRNLAGRGLTSQIPHNLYSYWVSSFSNFMFWKWSQKSEIILGISAGRGLILGSTLNSSQILHNLYSYRVSIHRIVCSRMCRRLTCKKLEKFLRQNLLKQFQSMSLYTKIVVSRNWRIKKNVVLWKSRGESMFEISYRFVYEKWEKTGYATENSELIPKCTIHTQ